jgi:hypothetical protein
MYAGVPGCGLGSKQRDRRHEESDRDECPHPPGPRSNGIVEQAALPSVKRKPQTHKPLSRGTNNGKDPLKEKNDIRKERALCPTVTTPAYFSSGSSTSERPTWSKSSRQSRHLCSTPCPSVSTYPFPSGSRVMSAAQRISYQQLARRRVMIIRNVPVVESQSSVEDVWH